VGPGTGGFLGLVGSALRAGDALNNRGRKMDFSEMNPNSPEALDWLMTELPKAEHLILAVKEGEPHHEFIVSSLTKMYGALNSMLRVKVKELQYPPQPWEWPDQRPLDLLTQDLPDLKATQWFEMQLMEMIWPTKSLQLRIWTSGDLTETVPPLASETVATTKAGPPNDSVTHSVQVHRSQSPRQWRNRFVGSIVLLACVINVLAVTFRDGNGPFTVYLEYGGEVSAVRSTWWGLKEELFDLKVIAGEWHFRSRVIESGRIKLGEWQPVSFEAPDMGEIDSY
jgi:hypothetical protein